MHEVDLITFKFCQNKNVPTLNIRREFKLMNLNEECLLKYLQNPDELIDLTLQLLEFNKVIDGMDYGQA